MKNILLLDDDKDFLFAAAAVFNSWGYITKGVTNSEQLFTSIKDEKPDIIFLDVHLKQEDGREVCKELVSKQLYRFIPIVMMSGLDFKNEEIECMPGTLFIKKPFEFDRVRNLLNNMLN
jgi:DNA-binding response OmpR family regulator